VPVVALRPVSDADLPLFLEWHHDAESVRLAAVAPRAGEQFHEHWARNRADPSVLLRAILADGEVAGYVSSWDADGDWVVGYWLGPPFWGRGIASHALARFLEVEPRRPLHATVAEHNAASRRVLAKAGFRPVGAVSVLEGPGGRYTALRLVLGGAVPTGRPV
jgi:RimJ/RimL family protein N-acetyltransferase